MINTRIDHTATNWWMQQRIDVVIALSVMGNQPHLRTVAMSLSGASRVHNYDSPAHAIVWYVRMFCKEE